MPPTRWHLNPDAPGPTSPWTDYTRVPPPAGFGTTITSTRAALAMTDEQLLTGSAFHEAGHAIVYTHHQVPIGTITHHTGGHNGASASIEQPSSSGPWEGYAVGTAAGHRAEIGWMRRTGLLTPNREWATERRSNVDRRFADTVVRQCFNTPLTYGDPLVHTDWAWMCDRADEVLADRWDAVERLAAALISQWGQGESVMAADTVKNLIKE